MNRVIKFRAWSDTEQQMLNMYDMRDFKFSEIEDMPNWEYKLMQWTGLKDRNGTEIFEGDVVSLFDPRQQVEHKRKVSEVTYADGAFLVDTQMGPMPDRTTLKTLYEYLEWREYSDCEVIGNIYEHPELLQRGDK